MRERPHPTGSPYGHRPTRRQAVRRRVVALVVLAVVIAGIAVAAVGPWSAPSGLRPAVTVSGRAGGRPLPAGFVGLSLEYQAVPAYLGEDPRAPDPVFVALLRALAPGAAPVLRIGGDSSDHAWWPASGTEAPQGVDYALTPAWLAVVRALADRTGARLILGVNLAADDLQLARREARALLAGVGRSHLAALEIGNEPDIYAEAAWYRAPDGAAVSARAPGWDLAQYASQFSAWQRAMPPGVPVAGPAFAKDGWLPGLPTFLAAEPGLGLVTDHQYPLRSCRSGSGTGDAPSPTIPRLLDAASSAGLAAAVSSAVADAHRDGLRFRLDELNSASCRGLAGVSDSFASALWILDTLFQLAAAGVDGVNVHTLPGAAYAPFSFGEREGRWQATVNPIYYGMLAFTQAFPAGARLLRVSAPRGPVKAWATRDAGGTVRVVLIDDSLSRSATVTVALPRAGTVTAERLTAPSAASRTGVTLGGRGFGAATTTGVLPAAAPVRLESRGGRVRVRLRAASAVILTAR